MKVLDMHCDTITRLYEEYPNESLLENTGHIDLKKMQKGDYLLQNFAMFTNLGNTSKPFLKVNQYINYYKGNTKVTQEDLEKIMKKGKINKDYIDSNDKEIETAAKRILKKIQTVNTEKMQWFEILIAMVLAIVAYNSPIWLLMFQAKMRQMEMEDEVMQFNTIILMLMKIERVNVEIILEWLERYANIFKEPISKCVNNYESGAWEALEQLKEEVSYQQFIRIVESLQAAVEKIPIADAFDELDTERDYYQAKRKESNERLIARKGRIGRIIGFTPMVVLFVGYLIVPLVFIGLTSMSTTFDSMSSTI